MVYAVFLQSDNGANKGFNTDMVVSSELLGSIRFQWSTGNFGALIVINRRVLLSGWSDAMLSRTPSAKLGVYRFCVMLQPVKAQSSLSSQL